MGLVKPLVHEIANKTWLINELGCNNMFVLEGPERSFVVDAGMGYCNFREIVENLTKKPYDVAITHAHPDHIGMMHQFDKIYIDRREVEGNDKFDLYTSIDGFSMEHFSMINSLRIGNWDVWTPTEDLICRGNIDTEIVYIQEGHVFDLGGGRIVTAYYLPGHTPGHLYFVDSGSRIAFTGDCVNFNNGTTMHAASTHIRYLHKIRSQYKKEYDRIFTGHTTYCGKLDVFSMEINVVDTLIEAYRAYLRGEAETALIPFHIAPEMPPINKIIFTVNGVRVEPPVPPALWEEGEEQIIP